ncbi:MAG: hypothetical protein KDB73_11695 [Planctomycetes bacterium]|nr:hypothetical protein [Planctomycetota bacterium]
MALPHSPASPGWRRLVVFVALVALASAGCGHDGTGHGVATREVDTPPGPGPVPETIRLGIERMPAMGTMPGGGAPTAAAAPTWDVDLPARWRRLPPRPFRDVNLTVDGIEGVECYLTVTEAGSLADNVNRWRQQLGQDPLGEAELAALPREPLAGAEAALVDLVGDMSAMGSTRKGVRLLGLVRAAPGEVLTLKLVGPADAVDGLMGEFLAVAAGLRRGTTAGAMPPGHPPLPGAGTAGAPEAAPVPAPTGGGGLTWRVPEGWRGGPRVMFSTASFEAGGTPPVLVTLSVMGQGAGGWEANAARWAAQVGAAAPGEGAYEAAEQIEALGTRGPLVRYDGTLTTRDGRSVDGASLAAIWLPRGDEIVIIKAVGRTPDLAAVLDEVRAFARSLEANP